MKISQHIFVAILLALAPTTLAQSSTDKELAALAESVRVALESGASTSQVADIGTAYWKNNFTSLKNKVEPETQAVKLTDLLDKYDQTSGSIQPQKDVIAFLWKEIENGNHLYGIGNIRADSKGLLRAMGGAVSGSLAFSNGKTITDLLSVITNNIQPTPVDLLVFRIVVENSSIGDNSKMLSIDQREYTPAEFSRLAQLSKHPNPVARLIAVEMLQYIPNAKEDATPELAAMMRGMKQEDNLAIIKRIVDRANRQRSEVYKDVLPEISKTLEKSNPKLKEEALGVMKVIEEAR